MTDELSTEKDDLEESLPVTTDAKVKAAFYRASEKHTKGIFREERYWKPVQDLVKELVEILPTFQFMKAQYSPDRPASSKTWEYVGGFITPDGKQRAVWGQIKAYGAGTEEDPLDSYDLTFNFNIMSPRNIKNIDQQRYLESLGMDAIGYEKRAAVMIDKLSNELESKGLIKEAYDLDTIANFLEIKG